MYRRSRPTFDSNAHPPRDTTPAICVFSGSREPRRRTDHCLRRRQAGSPARPRVQLLLRDADLRHQDPVEPGERITVPRKTRENLALEKLGQRAPKELLLI